MLKQPAPLVCCPAAFQPRWSGNPLRTDEVLSTLAKYSVGNLARQVGLVCSDSAGGSWRDWERNRTGPHHIQTKSFVLLLRRFVWQ